MIAAGEIEQRINEVAGVTYYAACRRCTWQTAPADELAGPLARARRHNARTGHVVDACTVHAITIT